jgi:hypoxanthine phosphoribosyltransferase
MIARHFEFGLVIGIPRGGIRLATALIKYTTLDARSVLIVDDVLTTGASMEQTRGRFEGSAEQIRGVVIFARAKCPDWITTIFQLNGDMEYGNVGSGAVGG